MYTLPLNSKEEVQLFMLLVVILCSIPIGDWAFECSMSNLYIASIIVHVSVNTCKQWVEGFPHPPSGHFLFILEYSDSQIAA